MKFRTSNHRFPVETYRWVGIPLSERKCALCDKDDIADELHYLLICPHFSAQRSRYIDTYYYRRPNILKFKELLSSTSCTQLKRLCKFVQIVIIVRPVKRDWAVLSRDTPVDISILKSVRQRVFNIYPWNALQLYNCIHLL